MKGVNLSSDDAGLCSDGLVSAHEQQAHRMKGALLEQARQHERLNQEMQALDWERWQLLQELRERDRQLAHEEGASHRQRAALASARGATKLYRVVCAFRVWRDQLHRTRAESLLSRTRNRLSVARTRHGCAVLRNSLRHALDRQIGSSVHALWFNAAMYNLGLQQEQRNVPDLPVALSPTVGARCGMLQESVEYFVTGAKCRNEPYAAPDSWAEPPELPCGTTRHGSPMTSRRSMCFWQPSPCLRRQSRFASPSEASTSIPSSASCLARNSMVSSTPISDAGVLCAGRPDLSSGVMTVAAGKMFLALLGPKLRRDFWAIGQWRYFTACEHAEDHNAHQHVADKSRLNDTAMKLRADHMLQLERRAVEREHEATAQRAAHREQCDELESRLHELQQSEVRLSQELRQEEQKNWRREYYLQKQRGMEEAAWREEERQVDQIRHRVSEIELQEAHAEASLVSTHGAYLESEETSQVFESTCLRLEAKLARRASWRSEAERQIREMVDCGEDLERERSQLLRGLKEIREQQRRNDEHTVALRSSLEQEEHLGEILKARSWALEEDNVSLAAELTNARRIRVEDQARFEAEKVAINSASVELQESLRAAGIRRGDAERRAADALVSWGREREDWSSIHDQLSQRACTLHAELELAQRQEASEAIAAQEARAAMDAADREDVCRRATALGGQLDGGDRLACAQVAGQLRQRLAQSQQREQELQEKKAHAATPAVAVTSEPSSSTSAVCPGVGLGADGALESATPRRLQELDTYAELVEQLKAEVLEEREEREASARSLASLRASYRLLLQRLSGNGLCQAAAA